MQRIDKLLLPTGEQQSYDEACKTCDGTDECGCKRHGNIGICNASRYHRLFIVQQTYLAEDEAYALPHASTNAEEYTSQRQLEMQLAALVSVLVTLAQYRHADTSHDYCHAKDGKPSHLLAKQYPTKYCSCRRR